jgi:hypothetical protein
MGWLECISEWDPAARSGALLDIKCLIWGIAGVGLAGAEAVEERRGIMGTRTRKKR